jgi:hypothetical protein
MDNLIEQAWWVRGVTACRGVAVVRPSYLAFIPCQRVQPIMDALHSAPLLDMRARELANQLSGVWWTLQMARLREKRFPLRRSRRGVWFEGDGASIRLARTLALPELRHATTLLATWPRAA